MNNIHAGRNSKIRVRLKIYIMLIVGVVLAWFKCGLPVVASACCVVVFVAELFIH